MVFVHELEVDYVGENVSQVMVILHICDLVVCTDIEPDWNLNLI